MAATRDAPDSGDPTHEPEPVADDPTLPAAAGSTVFVCPAEAGQVDHASHESLAEPVLKYPSVQAIHWVLSTEAYVPVAHWVQPDAPAAEICPAGHTSQDVAQSEEL